MAVTPAEVKKLRDKTGAGMLDCKKALIKADGNFAGAEKILKEQGLASAGKRSGRATNQGGIFTKIGTSTAALVELTCETDFVAKNDHFKESGAKIVAAVLENGWTEVNAQVEEMVKDAIAILKENMSVKRIGFVSIADDEMVMDYLHDGGKIGVMIKIKSSDASLKDKDEVKALAFDLALHAAAFGPAYLNREAVDAAYLKEQEEIFTTQAMNLGKPEKVVAGIVKGKLNKHLSRICFIDQPFVKDDKKSVTQVLAETGKALNTTLTLSEYVYFRVGEEA